MSTFAQYLDLHINLEEVPDYNSIEPEFSQEENFNKFAARFIQKLQQSLTSNNKQDLLRLYEGDFEWGVKKYPADKWVEAHIIEEECDLQFNLISQSIYNELVYRLQFGKQKQTGSLAEIASKSWNNYISLFEDVNEGNRKISLPEGWICDILDNFLSQFQSVHEWRSKQTVEQTIQNWTFEQIEKQLSGFYSKMINSGKLKLPEEISTVDLFGYFSIVYHLKLKTLQGKFTEALNLIQIICLDHTIIYSKSFLSQLNLFYYSSFCYFMTQKYMESVKLAETIAIFFESYKAFIKQSLDEKKLIKINEKVLALWCLANIFEGNQPHDLIVGILSEQKIITKERNYEELLIDKYQKLSQFDNNAFLELFSFVAPLLVNDKKGQVQEIKGTQQRFENLKKINLNTVLKLYTRIEVPKMARFLNINEQKLQQSLKQYGQSKASLMQTPWQSTILKSLLKFEGEFTVQVRDNIVYIEKEGQRKDGKDYSYLINGINDIAKNLAKV